MIPANFGRGDDRTALDGNVLGLVYGTLAPRRFVIGDAAGDSNDRMVYDDAIGRLFDADGTGARAQILITTLTGAPALTGGRYRLDPTTIVEERADRKFGLLIAEDT